MHDVGGWKSCSRWDGLIALSWMVILHHSAVLGSQLSVRLSRGLDISDQMRFLNSLLNILENGVR